LKASVAARLIGYNFEIMQQAIAQPEHFLPAWQALWHRPFGQHA